MLCCFAPSVHPANNTADAHLAGEGGQWLPRATPRGQIPSAASPVSLREGPAGRNAGTVTAEVVATKMDAKRKRWRQKYSLEPVEASQQKLLLHALEIGLNT
ncbi:hypothetical protein SKAU_G00039470 [Synaphobranchus kaupii]|uniref:Uncharacterized protein n=1 Tax=Synaphobranchus kaupii TaxID=118154 RepID=A0A9Q1GH98_SYNKA|nr:hypothetical protein SKAU_G00039470 [Synaphobranchus kaupii]